MPANDSVVEISWFQHPQHGPSLIVVAADPDGIRKIEIFSRHRRVPRIINLSCPKHAEEVVFHYPKSWFPVTVRITDCAKNVDVHGPFDEDGDSLGLGNDVPQLPPPVVEPEEEPEEQPGLPDIDAAVRRVLTSLRIHLG